MSVEFPFVVEFLEQRRYEENQREKLKYEKIMTKCEGRFHQPSPNNSLAK